MNRKKIRIDGCNHKQCAEDNGCLKTCCQQKHCSGRITASLNSSTAVFTSIAHRYHSAATIDQNIVLHQTMRQISTPTIKQFWNTSLLDVQSFKWSTTKSAKVEHVVAEKLYLTNDLIFFLI